MMYKHYLHVLFMTVDAWTEFTAQLAI